LVSNLTNFFFFLTSRSSELEFHAERRKRKRALIVFKKNIYDVTSIKERTLKEILETIDAGKSHLKTCQQEDTSTSQDGNEDEANEEDGEEEKKKEGKGKEEKLVRLVEGEEGGVRGIANSFMKALEGIKTRYEREKKQIEDTVEVCGDPNELAGN
jgi:hypothetical protein